MIAPSSLDDRLARGELEWIGEADLSWRTTAGARFAGRVLLSAPAHWPRSHLKVGMVCREAGGWPCQSDLFIIPRRPWNADRLIGPKAPLKPKHIWAIRQQLKVAKRVRDLAMFNCALHAKLRPCDLV